MAQNTQNPTGSDDFNMSERQLKFAYWFVTHKILLKKIALTLGFAASFLFLLYGIYGFVDYFLISGPKEAKYLAELPRSLVNPDVIYKERARSLEILSAHLVPSGGKYDLAGKIRNSNDKWQAEFDYYFLVEGAPTEFQEGFILPREEKFLFKLAVEAPRNVRTASLVIDNVRWQKINPHRIPDYALWKRTRFNFPVSDISFDGSARADTKVFSQAKFKVKNSTAFDFWHVDFKVILYRGPVIAGANFVRIERFNVGEERELVATWYEPMPGITRVEVHPEVNIFDERNYIK